MSSQSVIPHGALDDGLAVELRLPPSAQLIPLRKTTDFMSSLPEPNWSAVEQTIRKLPNANSHGIQEFKFRISNARIAFSKPRVSAEKASRKDFQKAARLLGQLTPVIERISAEIHDGEGLKNELSSLVLLKRYADIKLDGIWLRELKPTVEFHFQVLRAWVALGGELKVSYDAITGKVRGPLARYFSAVTKGVTGASTNSLRDIIKQHRAILKEYGLPE